MHPLIKKLIFISIIVVLAAFGKLFLAAGRAYLGIGGTYRGRICQTYISEGHVVFVLSHNKPSDKIAVPISEFKEEMLKNYMKYPDNAAYALMTIGEVYIGCKIEINQEPVKLQDGSRFWVAEKRNQIKIYD